MEPESKIPTLIQLCCKQVIENLHERKENYILLERFLNETQEDINVSSLLISKISEKSLVTMVKSEKYSENNPTPLHFCDIEGNYLILENNKIEVWKTPPFIETAPTGEMLAFHTLKKNFKNKEPFDEHTLSVVDQSNNLPLKKYAQALQKKRANMPNG